MTTYRKEYDANADYDDGGWVVYQTPDGETEEELICTFETETLADLMLAAFNYAATIKLDYSDVLDYFDGASSAVTIFNATDVSQIAESMSLNLSQNSAESFLAERREALQLHLHAAGCAWLEQQLRKHPPTD